jgi:hypothetical protein
MATILVVLILLWALGFLRLPGVTFHNVVLFRLFGHGITLWEILMFIVIAWAMESLPTPLRQIAFVLVILWLLSIFGLITIAGFSNMVVIAILIGLVVSLFRQ